MNETLPASEPLHVPTALVPPAEPPVLTFRPDKPYPYRRKDDTLKVVSDFILAFRTKPAREARRTADRLSLSRRACDQIMAAFELGLKVGHAAEQDLSQKLRSGEL